MTLRELCKSVRPAQRIRIKNSINDPGIVRLRYEVLDESGLVDPSYDPMYLDWQVRVIQSDPMYDNSIHITIRRS